jgi:lysophospholipase L1-like esterase
MGCTVVFLVFVWGSVTFPMAQGQRWVGSWATASTAQNADALVAGLKIGAGDVTLREVVHTSMAGNAIRIVLTNEFGTESLKIGAVAVSDPVAFAAPAQSNLAISLFVPSQILTMLSYHSLAETTNFIADSDQTLAMTLSGAKAINSWFLLKSVDVRTVARDAGAIVAFGDSITDGLASTLGSNARWPDILAARLQTNPRTKHFGVLNEGISGNRVLHDDFGPNALARFDRDVLSQSGVKYLIILEGINDIGRFERKKLLRDVISADDLIWGLTQMAERAHVHGIKVYGATLTPYEGAEYFSPEGEKIRMTLNAWIRKSEVFDGVIDFEKNTRDPIKTTRFLPAYDHGDHLHSSDEGYKAMAYGINLALFK